MSAAQREALERAADTFRDISRAAFLLGHTTLAAACDVAEKGTRAAIQERESVREHNLLAAARTARAFIAKQPAIDALGALDVLDSAIAAYPKGPLT